MDETARPPETVAPEARKQSRGRTAAMWTLLVVSGLLLLLTSFAVWVNRVALNTQAFTDTSSELLADDAIRLAVATRAVDQLYEAVDVQAEVEDQLPDDLKSLSGPAAAGLRQLSYQVIYRALEQPRLQNLFSTAVEQAHKTLVNVLSGGGDVTSTSGGVVSLDLSQIVLETADRIGIRSQVEDKLPADVGNIEILRSDQLNTAQNAFELLKTLAWLLPFLTLVAIGLAFWVARERRRAVRGIGIVILVIGALGLIAARLTGTYLVNSLVADTETQTAANHTWLILSDALRGAFRSLVFLGILFIFAAMLAGPTRWALEARKWLAPALRNRIWAYLVLAAIWLVLLAASDVLDFARLIYLLLAALLGAGFIEAMRTKTIHEFPDAAMPAFVGETRARVGAWWVQARESISAPRRPAEPTDVTSRLANLADLHSRGELSDEEYAAAKAQVLSGS
jgi:hypothetical protein